MSLAAKAPPAEQAGRGSAYEVGRAAQRNDARSIVAWAVPVPLGEVIAPFIGDRLTSTSFSQYVGRWFYWGTSPMSRSGCMSECARPHARVEGGFTLVELVITLAVLAIIVTLALPAFTALVNGNRLTAQANELVADLQAARMEAITRNRPVTLCPSADNATCSGGDWGNRIMTAPAGAGVEVIRTSAAKGVLSVTGDAGSIVFRPDGFARAAAGGALLDAQFAVCLPTTAPANNVRQVTLAAGSRIATEPDSTAGVCP